MLRDQGFAAALHALAEQVGATNRIRIDLDVGESGAPRGNGEVALYTIIRELLDQSVRRGPPTRVGVTMTTTADGGHRDSRLRRRRAGTPPPPFETIEERVKQLHGTIELSVEHERTTVTVMLPAYADPALPARHGATGISSSSGRLTATRCASCDGDPPHGRRTSSRTTAARS